MDGYVELLNAEKRSLEDQLYDMTYEYESQHRKLERLINENQRLRQQVGGDQGAQTVPAPSGAPRPVPIDSPDVQPLSPPAIEAPPLTAPPSVVSPTGSRGNGPESLGAPLPADPESPDGEPAIPDVPELPQDPPPAGGAQAVRPAAATQDDHSPEGWPTNNASRPPNKPRRQVAAIAIEAVARDFDQRPGPDGFEMRFNATDQDGRAIEPQGRLRVALIDGLQLDRNQIAAMWEFTAEEIAAAAAEPDAAFRGLKLPMTWREDDPPTQSQARLAVRFHAADGRTFDVQTTLQLPASEWKAR